ncbi:hypothetical protein ABW20_dc0107181 [Dactylellina cionopaga]|nr:hypothetical protein ABW20_dc0107181 [Dactylellina cionopaga]
MPITSLPVELQEQVFSHLNWQGHFRCYQVCKLWRSIITTSRSIKDAWYTPCDDPDINASIHTIFTTYRVGCIYTAAGFRVLLPHYNYGEIRGTRMILAPGSPLLEEPLFKPPLPNAKVSRDWFQIFILGSPLCGDGQIMVPWEDVEGASIEDGYVRVSVRSFLSWLSNLIGPEPGMPYEEGAKYELEFLCSQDLPWRVGLWFPKLVYTYPNTSTVESVHRIYA